MDSVKATARRAGVIYLLFALMQPLNFVFGSRVFVVPGDAAATAQDIVAAETTYRIGILTGLATHLVFLLVVLAVYHLLKDVDRRHARLMLVLVAVGVAVSVANLSNKLAPLVLLGSDPFSTAFTKPQIDQLVLAFLRLHGQGIQVAIAFWGLWLLPFGMLVIRSGFIPKTIGVLLILGGVAYVAVSVTALLFPEQRSAVSQWLTPVYAAGELTIIGWLLVKGAVAREHSA